MRYNHRRTAFSLLEVLLALGLSVIVVGAIGMAMRLHMTTLARQQAEIESRQVARSLIMMINNDVRAGIQYRAQDFSALDNLVISEQMAAGIFGAMSEDANADNDEAAAAGAAQAAAAGGAGAAQAGGEGEGGEEESAIMEECASCRPTFIGTPTSISIDISHLPRVDEYNPLIAAITNNESTPSDVKSVAYFVDLNGPDTQQNQFQQRAQKASGGLYRRQIDRAVAAFRQEEASLIIDDYAQLVAPEVAEISLRYFDGEQWVAEWDSEEAGGFPPAVEVVVVIDPARVNNPDDYR